MFGKKNRTDKIDISFLAERSELDVFTDRIKRDLIQYAISLEKDAPGSVQALRNILFEKSKECPNGKNLSGKGALEGPEGIIAILKEQIKMASDEPGLRHNFYEAIIHDYEVMVGSKKTSKVKSKLDAFEDKLASKYKAEKVGKIESFVGKTRMHAETVNLMFSPKEKMTNAFAKNDSSGNDSPRPKHGFSSSSD